MDRTFFSKYFSLEIRLLLIALLALNQLQAQNGDIFLPAQEENIIEMEIDVATQLKWLENAPLENTAASKSKIILISLPHPDGTYRDYKVVKAPIVSKDYQKKLGPNFQTYTLHDYDNPTTFGKLTITPTGLNAVILTTEGNIYIEPLSIGNKTHKVYWEKDGKRFVHTYPDIENYVHQHSPEETPHEHEDPIAKSQGLSLGVTLRQFDMLVLARPDYSAQHIGSATVLADQIANVEAAIMTTINNMNAYFERDMALRLNMVTPIVFINDPEDNFGNSVALFNETLSPASQNLNAFEQLIVDDPNIDWDGIDINTFDFAHLFGGTGGNGSAFLGVVCKNTFINVTGVGTFSLRKAGGGSISSNATGSSWYQLVAHEVCHQFNGQHTFNGSASNCGNAGQYAATDAYEPGSGTSIMSYHDICGDDNILDLETGFSTTIFYFHINSILNVEDYITNDDGQNCRTDVANSNNPPVAEADPCNAGTVTIPVNTPFELTGSATDIDVGDGLTYSWEQFDLGIQGSFDVGVTDNLGDDGIGGAENGAPIFRSRDPEDSPTRQFPTTAVLQNFTLGCGDLFISEILQGPGNDQCVEIYNPTDQAIDFSVTPYELVFGIDGSSSLQILTLSSGTIAANDVLVFCNTSISLAVVADVFYPSSLIIDGNDFIGLRKNSELIDEFGILGFNPGASGWTTIDNNPIFASGISFVRKPFICDGDNENSNSFNAFTEYNVSVLSISDIGSHTNGPEVLGEGLPLVDRIMTFNMTARDNNGGVDYDTRTINVSANGPLIVSTPSSAQNTGTSVSISWNANGFSGCSNADIFLSTDGGETFSYEVANNIDFSLGTHTFTLPLGIPSTTNAVYKVKCVDYECVAFFNWSREFEISSACT
ncbi:MAG: M12 family metallo-peptidase, partial [Bacteroidota bacterium]